MFTDRVMLFLLYFVTTILYNSATYSLKNKEKACHQFNTCKCIFPTGRGINLNPIIQNMSVQLQPNTNILLHLCEDVSFGEIVNNTINQCFHNVSICLVDASKNQSLSLGKAENMKIISESQFLPISIQFTNEGNATNIDLICDEGDGDPKLTFKSANANIYNLELHSKHACVHQFTSAEGPPGQLSTGSVLIIMLLVFTLVYFIGGMLTLKLLRGAEGREMIPNIDFWMDLPYLVRDGVLFALNGFRPPATYDRI